MVPLRVYREKPFVNFVKTFYINPFIGDLKETGSLVYGPGSKNDSSVARALVKPTPEQATQIQKAKKYAMEVSIKMVLMKQTKHLGLLLLTSYICRIYVGCINYDTREESIKQAFNAFGPIRSITMSWDPTTQKHKGFAFVEFETPEGAQLAEEQMNGVLVCGRNIKVRNSVLFCADVCTGYGYVEYETLQCALDAISSMNLFDLGGQYLRVGRAVTPPDAKNLGPVSTAPPSALPNATAMAAAAVSAKLTALDAVAKNKKIVLNFVQPTFFQKKKRRSRSRSRSREEREREKRRREEREKEKIKKEIKKEKESSKPIPVPPLITKDEALETPDALKNAAAAAQQLELLKKLDEGQEPVTLAQHEDMSIKGVSARQLVMQKLMKNRSESVVLLIRNMVGADEVDEELQGDIEEECNKYGKVEHVIIYKEQQDEDQNSEIVVKIFVEFQNFDQVKTARDALHGRFFSGRKITAIVYDQELYDQQDLSG
ncbi:poly(U)-binding-splicing factor half pint [Eurytemora carolleeae]|uniref:poly(U)-binding-splicing factor half pint n=1 Tax=Eurytemora carolleeae TaxID=1294199 RepID=UPI000C76923C|nr:poly(U)-binding-splicing factor half pint [Eurytemora carolleeae]|eukprot:XP_023338461.1 poly(U)-binding-splicing factor half pint-like [Eurytemora affinis]